MTVDAAVLAAAGEVEASLVAEAVASAAGAAALRVSCGQSIRHRGVSESA